MSNPTSVIVTETRAPEADASTDHNETTSTSNEGVGESGVQAPTGEQTSPENNTNSSATGDTGEGTEKAPAGFDDLDAANREIVRLRREAKAARLNAKETAAEEGRADVIGKIAEALGITPATGDGSSEETSTPSTVEELTARVTEIEAQAAARAAELEAELATTRKEATVIKTAAVLGVDVDRLLDSRSFMTALTAATDDVAITELVATTVEANPLLKGAPATPAITKTSPETRTDQRPTLSLAEQMRANLRAGR